MKKSLFDGKQLGFGYQETDELFVAHTDEHGQWQEGEILPFGDLSISPAASALNYGQSAFEGLKAQRTQDGDIVLFRPEQNAMRLQHSAQRLLMPPYPIEAFCDAVRQVVKANERWIPPFGQGSLYIRPVLFGSGPVLGVNPAPNYTFYIFVCPVGHYLPGAGHVIIKDGVYRATPGGTGGVKAAGNYALTLDFQRQAKQAGYKDLLYLDAQQAMYIEELSSSNFFAILGDGTLITPNSPTILPGVTRDSILTIAREVLGWPVQERPILIDEVLHMAKEAFFTGTAAVLQPITLINYTDIDYPIGHDEMGEKTRQLYDTLIAIQTCQRADPFSWVHTISC